MSNILGLLLSATSQGLLWSLLAIGVWFTFRILDIADLTAEGSFPLGGGIAAVGIVNGLNPVAATLLAFVGGMAAGLVTGILNTKFKIPPLLAGIITMTGLYSITSRVMGAPNIALLGEDTLFSGVQTLGLSRNNSVILIGLLIALIAIILLILFFRTEIGLAVRATGDNPDMSEANGIKIENMKLLGYMISNGCIALSGALLAQNNGFADLNSGVGTIVIGLASIIIAEVLLRNKPIAIRLGTIVVGAILYRFILALVFEMNVEPSDSKLASAIVLVICLSLPQIREKLNLNIGKSSKRENKKGEKSNAASLKN
ncbi:MULTISPECIES: ABC transporter permease [Enterococcus]|uniref:ABC transporter permease n=1 Tax=Enterococcus alishanensis TaxID=1303817 RepID=A0ABS6TGC0_9ENTE|nr:ABC transporter permease [Enterococcus alishanensis]MBV7391945.1 ABC transporter permease [Enterococcus alishanensis]